MRFLLCCLFAVFLFPTSSISQTGGRMKPPGIVTADTVSNEPMEAPPSRSRTKEVDLQQVNAEMQQLQTLVNGLPRQIQQAESNEYPKDLESNLKQIEKLAKHLRSQLVP